MKNDSVYLTYYQVASYLHALQDLKDNNPYFKDGISEKFENYVLQRTKEITLLSLSSPLKLKLSPNAGKYEVSKSMLGYLTRLTGVDVMDESVLQDYTERIKAKEEELLQKNVREGNNSMKGK